MPSFDELVEEAEKKDSFDNSEYTPEPKPIETNGAERAEEVGQESQTAPQEQQQSQGFFGKLKNAFWTSPEDKQQKEMIKMKAEEERLNSQLAFQQQKTELANKKAKIAKIAQERRANSPMGRTFSKIGKFVTENAQQKGQVRNPMAEFGQAAIGIPNQQRDAYGQNAGVNFGLAGRPAPQPKPMPQKKGRKGKKSNMYKKQQQPQKPAYQTQQPYGSGMMNTNMLNEFGPQSPPSALTNNQNKPKPKRDLGLMSGRW